MKILVAPLNWGLGHATRCIPLIRRFVADGNEVVLGGDGMALELLKKHFPELPYKELPALHIHYSSGRNQVTSLLAQLPKLLRFCRADRRYLRRLLNREHFDQIVSDNRFCLRDKRAHCIYITHQLTIKMPRRLKWAEPVARRIHGAFIRKFDQCWIPDRAENSLSGDLSHAHPLPANASFIGVLSRFNAMPAAHGITPQELTVAVLSGPEPQRTLFEDEIRQRYAANGQPILIVQGKITGKNQVHTCTDAPNIRLTPYLDDDELQQHLLSAKKIIARSGYSTIMDLETLGVLHKAELTPTPGQTEQEYLAEWLKTRPAD